MHSFDPEHRHLSAAGVSVVLTWDADTLPALRYWGRQLDARTDIAAVARLTDTPTAFNGPDVPSRASILPDSATGWMGTPGVRGHRGPHHWSPRFTDVVLLPNSARNQALFTARDALADLALLLEISLNEHGVLVLEAVLRNDSPHEYALDGFDLVLALPDSSTELLDFAGRWSDERVPQRGPIRAGTHLRENRRGRTGHDSAHLMTAGSHGFGFESGEVRGVHVAWSGNTRTFIERLPTGEQVIGGGELLLPGEVTLTKGQTYKTPKLWAVFGDGLDEQAARLHRSVRQDRGALTGTPQKPRPVTLNVWEAVYFNHDLEKLLHLAEVAAQAGVERFVLDDGWFKGRRDDTAGLGDWTVDEHVWPEGLHPLVNRVRELGMEFGLWFEPEMVNRASDLAAAHPDWVMGVPGRQPLTARNQNVLNLTDSEAAHTILEAVSAVINEYDIDYIKLDHNRDLFDAADSDGKAAVHRQTKAFYALLKHLTTRHPNLEIESCSSGGGRVDLGVIPFVDRFWASDNNDPLDRQHINLWTAQLVPPEYIGSHVAAERNHITGRSSSLDFRAMTCLPWHMGVECDLTQLTADELSQLSGWITRHKEYRRLTHSGRLVRSDQMDSSQTLYGFVSADGSEAIFFHVALSTGTPSLGRMIALPGLQGDLVYEVQVTHVPSGGEASPPPWWSIPMSEPHTITGAVLRQVGMRAPFMHPESFTIYRLAAAQRAQRAQREDLNS